jgi:hypothetical protein
MFAKAYGNIDPAPGKKLFEQRTARGPNAALSVAALQTANAYYADVWPLLLFTKAKINAAASMTHALNIVLQCPPPPKACTRAGPTASHISLRGRRTTVSAAFFFVLQVAFLALHVTVEWPCMYCCCQHCNLVCMRLCGACGGNGPVGQASESLEACAG